jgi:hypothetical protein
MSKKKKENVKKLAEDHVNWFLAIVKPLLIANFIHGHKHGQAKRLENKQ